MRIAQIGPLIESVPPRYYGGTERIVSYLTEELVAQGHDVTLFASGDSITSANLVSCCTKALRLNPDVRDPIPYYMIMLDRVRRMAPAFDIMHFHIDQFHFPLFHGIASHTMTTLHGRQDLRDLQQLYHAFPDMPLVSISDSQRTPLPFANFAGTVYHGLPQNLHRPTFAPHGGYMAFVGRISPEKRLDRAIEIAHAVGFPIKIAAKIDKVDVEYFEQKIKPLLSGGDVEFVGEISDADKSRFIGEASALLFPIDWPEPFGLVMIEAMACGTPVLAFNHGSVREVIDNGVTGYIVDSVEEAVAIVPQLLALDRRRVHRQFEKRFTAARMAKAYTQLYARALASRVPMRERISDEVGPPMETAVN
ncbi:glycosyl transferase [Hyphomicrobium methylovorum]|uniref:glycosyltransferase family 4 protein n=1 Tax=Hyphomicrobium methylovorum TaxID=84 RepID=UPI0015E66CB7|nr:glycosyltransferase family 4 protein [Hyphomicrobium methylovorum]MBA2127626.1 glycosyl transferase [Hyphomicrobium methylovorum]